MRAEGQGWVAYNADTVDVARAMPDKSVDFAVFSPPFASLYTYSNSPRDMGNCRGPDDFFEHYRFLIREQARVMRPGRQTAIHCMLLPTSKERDGHIGLRDFRGEIIRAYEAEGFLFHSEVVIWKDPVTAMQRTKALGLLWKQLKKDSTMSRQGIELWQKYASPVWMDINPSDTLQKESAREEEDERHVAPLQLEVIRRAVRLWSNPGDLVWSPFMGIGSEGFVALQEGRRFIGAELKRSYFDQARRNLASAEAGRGQTDFLATNGLAAGAR